MHNNIDIVVLYLDNSDPKWKAEYEKYSEDNSTSVRFENIDTIKYTLRGIDKFIPWVNNIFIVTYGHYPKWLNIKNNKIKIVNHTDIFPDINVLPTFNSNAIDINIHRIEGLSEQFIYFNDDLFIMSKLDKEDFFTNGKPNDFYIPTPFDHGYSISNTFPCKMHSNMVLINNEIRESLGKISQIRYIFNLHYGIGRLIKSMLLLFTNRHIPMFEIYHHPQPFLKSNLIEVEEKFKVAFENTRKSRFRASDNITQYLFRFYALIHGKFHPKKNKNTYYIGVNDLGELQEKILKLKNKKVSLVCFNEEDNFPVDKYTEYKKIIENYLNTELSNKSVFEK